MAVDNQPVLDALAEHAHQAQRVRGRKVAVARDVEHTYHMALGVEHGSGRATHETVGLEKVLVMVDVQRLPACQCGTQGVGTSVLFHPAGTWRKPPFVGRGERSQLAPCRDHPRLMVGKPNQAMTAALPAFKASRSQGIADAQQTLMGSQPAGQCRSLQGVEMRPTVGVQAPVAAATPGVFD